VKLPLSVPRNCLRMSGIPPPKIIVIPQSLLQSQAQGKSLLRLFPQGKAMTTVSGGVPAYTNIVTKPPTLTLNNNMANMARPVATITGQKRPAPVSTPNDDCLIIKEEFDDEERGTVRKRANLDHMSPEERLMRRKLKNRVAAQTARDKKRAHLEEMEVVVDRLREERRRLLEDKNRMQVTNNQLQIDNAALLQENQELRARLALDVKIEPESQDILLPASHMPPSPASLPRSPLPPVSPPPRPDTQTPPESAALTNDPRQQEQGLCVEGRKPGPGLSSSDLTTWPAICAVWWITLIMMTLNQTSLAAFLAVVDKKQQQQPEVVRSSQPPPLLPIKKRGVSHWWGVEEREWSPTMRESPQE